ncbi:PTS transporter subunit EIIC [Streptomyces sp. SP17BM10]|uniref:PTS transporter subunit EIIC n=1 Tax=Streptomyces sp. SP17BM10 TaxID=3002530 RepID=UPI002E75A6A5|nr:PTS transporter subunit EIIC [Streptomyces sp. SP17BM10]MEE1781769.1 PTS transporter subunit EIIC [Streptomyces sp. SP17BM10]
MTDTHTGTARDLLALVGGAANVTSTAHCISRLRLGLADPGLARTRQIKDHPAVLGVVVDDTYQIVLGPAAVDHVAQAFDRALARERAAAATTPATDAHALAARGAALKDDRARRNATPGKLFLRRIADIFVPLIPALVACGVIAGLGATLNSLALSTHTGALTGIVPVTTALSQGFMSLIAVFVGHNTAKEFGGTPVLGGAVAAIVVHPGVAAITHTPFGHLKPGQGGVLGALAAAALCAALERQARRRIPDALQMLLVPTLALALSGLAALLLLMPLAGLLADGIGNGATWLLAHAGAGAGVVLGGTFATLVMFGLHQALIPIHTTLIEQQGYSALYPILAMAGAGQAGAAVAVYLRARHNPSLRRVIRSALPTCVLGVAEPVIYGVTLPLVRPFVTAGIGAAVGGAVVGAFAQFGLTTGSTAVGPSGLVLLPLLDGSHGIGPAVLVYTGGWLTAALAACAVTHAFGFTPATLTALNAPAPEAAPDPAPPPSEAAGRPEPREQAG